VVAIIVFDVANIVHLAVATRYMSNPIQVIVTASTQTMGVSKNSSRNRKSRKSKSIYWGQLHCVDAFASPSNQWFATTFLPRIPIEADLSGACIHIELRLVRVPESVSKH
jgi:5-hydroxyisourate hydrolase-like protein (transthyretin family)